MINPDIDDTTTEELARLLSQKDRRIAELEKQRDALFFAANTAREYLETWVIDTASPLAREVLRKIKTAINHCKETK